MQAKQRNLIKISFIFTVLVYIVSHGYRMTHNMYSYDSLLMIYQNDYAWQIALGRFMIPVLVFLRGSLCNPWMISIITIVWNVLTVYCICKMYDIDETIYVAVIAGILVCNPTAIAMNASYIIDVDFYALACFLSVLCVYLYKYGCENYETGNKKLAILYMIASIVSLAVSLSIYQAYICVAVGLFMINLILYLIDKKKLSDIVTRVVLIVIIFIVAGAVYYTGWKILQKIFNIWTANTYNGLDSVGDYSETSILSQILECYRRVGVYLMYPDVFASLKMSGRSLSFIWRYFDIIANFAVVGYSIFFLVKNNIRSKTTLISKTLQVVLVVLFPFGINIVCFISKGMEHSLMIYAFNLVYILMVVLARLSNYNSRVYRIVFVAPLLVILWTNFVFANQVYLKKQLLHESASSLMTRMITDIEDIDGYVPGKTKVAIYGSFELAPNIPELADFEEVVCYGMAKSNISYIDLDYSFLKHILNVDMNLVRVDGNDEDVMKVVKNMPCYPEHNSVMFVGDTIVVKISDL